MGSDAEHGLPLELRVRVESTPPPCGRLVVERDGGGAPADAGGGGARFEGWTGLIQAMSVAIGAAGGDEDATPREEGDGRTQPRHD